MGSRAGYRLYYNLLMAHDVMQAALWRMIAPAVDEAVFRDAYRMVFVLGCGRSGTTIFSRCLGQHPDITELNEPKHIWIGTDSEADILSPFARFSRGRMRFDQRDVSEKTRARYRAMVDYQVKRRSPIVCDKAPMNTCRVGYVAALNPGAKFIHLKRSPRAVARSIERCVQRDGSWWGFNDYKWRALCRCAAGHPELKGLIDYAVNDYYRGLVEWRINQQLAMEDLSRLPPEQQMDVRYEDLVADPHTVLADVAAFCGVPYDQAVADFAAGHIKPQSADKQTKKSAEDDRLHAAILGDLDDRGERIEEPALAVGF